MRATVGCKFSPKSPPPPQTPTPILLEPSPLPKNVPGTPATYPPRAEEIPPPAPPRPSPPLSGPKVRGCGVLLPPGAGGLHAHLGTGSPGGGKDGQLLLPSGGPQGLGLWQHKTMAQWRVCVCVCFFFFPSGFFSPSWLFRFFWVAAQKTDGMSFSFVCCCRHRLVGTLSTTENRCRDLPAVRTRQTGCGHHRANEKRLGPPVPFLPFLEEGSNGLQEKGCSHANLSTGGPRKVNSEEREPSSFRPVKRFHPRSNHGQNGRVLGRPSNLA